MLPLEVLVHMLEVGAFTFQQLASLRLVNRALCAAASDPSFYRAFTCDSVADLEALPPFVAKSLRRVNFCGRCKTDAALVAALVPNISSLTTFAITNVCANLRQLSVDKVLDADLLGRHTNLECLRLGRVRHTPPVALLPLLTRLRLDQFRADPGDLMSALASAPCAATLEALYVHVWYTAEVTPGWWDLLTGLGNLSEFGLADSTDHRWSSEEADAFANILAAGNPRLAVLELEVPEALASAVLLRGFPFSLTALRFIASNAEFDALVAALPPDLMALQIATSDQRSTADLSALLSRCPQLHALSLSCDDEVVEYLASGNLVDRSLLLDRAWFGRHRASDALTAAGHRVGSVFVGVHWRIAGGVVWNGEAVVF